MFTSRLILVAMTLVALATQGGVRLVHRHADMGCGASGLTCVAPRMVSSPSCSGSGCGATAAETDCGSHQHPDEADSNTNLAEGRPATDSCPGHSDSSHDCGWCELFAGTPLVLQDTIPTWTCESSCSALILFASADAPRALHATVSNRGPPAQP